MFSVIPWRAMRTHVCLDMGCDPKQSVSQNSLSLRHCRFGSSCFCSSFLKFFLMYSVFTSNIINHSFSSLGLCVCCCFSLKCSWSWCPTSLHFHPGWSIIPEIPILMIYRDLAISPPHFYQTPFALFCVETCVFTWKHFTCRNSFFLASLSNVVFAKHILEQNINVGWVEVVPW